MKQISDKFTILQWPTSNLWLGDRKYFKTDLYELLGIIQILIGLRRHWYYQIRTHGNYFDYYNILNWGVPIVGINRMICANIYTIYFTGYTCIQNQIGWKSFGFHPAQVHVAPFQRNKRQATWPPSKDMISTYRETSNISRTLVGNKLVDHWDIVGASPVSAAPTTSSLST